MIEDRLSLEDLLLATLDAVSRFRALASGTPLAPRSRPGPCSPKPRADCNMGSGETGCIVWAWHRARRPRG